MTHYDLVLFDADGTLFDYDAGEAAALEHTLGGFGLTCGPTVTARYRRINASLWAQLEQGAIGSGFVRVERFRRLFEELGCTADPVDASSTYLDALSRQAQVMDGAVELLKSLSGRFRIAILTNGISSVQRSRFRMSGLDHLVERLIISEEVGAAKPDPAIFDFTLQAMGCRDRDRVIIVGDSLASDMKGGAAASIATCWFNPAATPNTSNVIPDFEIRALRELVDIVGA